ncbi:hypothetical protein CC78DRAFT_531322 [Lojkania enalia]|uniref:Uncharacterized protein n=1 Tax=Lojkania enalia TaxID=147567 RepID=A0A9P4KDX8_9PLEO|nr:hypothetical protein CC78DRAFT_531322 [Didymosphaeria enalia]
MPVFSVVGCSRHPGPRPTSIVIYHSFHSEHPSSGFPSPTCVFSSPDCPSNRTTPGLPRPAPYV